VSQEPLLYAKSTVILDCIVENKTLNYLLSIHVYEIAEKSPQQQFEGNIVFEWSYNLMRVACKVSDYPITFLITNSGDELQ
jgi:hypothetical protein